MKVLFFLIFSHLLAASYSVDEIFPLYIDEELECLWNSLDNLYNPSEKDYRKITEYLKFGRRPYLDSLFQHAQESLILQKDTRTRPFHDRSEILSYRVLQDIQLISTSGQMPQCGMIPIGNATIKDKSRCIILYATYNQNSLFADKLFQIIQELKEEGYNGHVFYRIGGYPLIDLGGIRFVHIPYSFKILSLMEASEMGYENILWMDCSIHPANDLSSVFETIEKSGVYFLRSTVNLDFEYSIDLIPSETIFACDLDLSDLQQIPHIMTGIFGISMKFQASHDFLDEWFHLTALTLPTMSLYPEEIPFSIASWKTKQPITAFFLEKTDNQSQIPIKPHHAQKPFWFDKQ